MDIATALMSRFKEEWRAPSHRLRPLHGLMGEALATADMIAAKREEFARSGAFSAKGLTEAIRVFIAGEVLPTLKNVRVHFHIALARHQVAANRAGRLRSGALLGGKLVVARIDAGGIGMRTLDAFSPA